MFGSEARRWKCGARVLQLCEITDVIIGSIKESVTMVEHERKFLVPELPSDLDEYPHDSIEQGYLAIEARDDFAEVRLRRIAKRYVLTVKQGQGATRLEEEVSLSSARGRKLWPLTRGRRIEKVRYKIPYQGLTIELDVYGGKAQGLVVAEVEFNSGDALRGFDPPRWLGKEVTGQEKFANSRIASVVGIRTGGGRSERTFRIKRREAIPDGLRRIVRECLSDAVASLSDGAASSDVKVHEARKRFKEVRATLRLVRDELGADAFDRENRAVRDAARPLSEVRDTKMLIERLDTLSDQLQGMASESLANLRGELVARRRAARARAIGATDTVPTIVRDLLAMKKRVRTWPLRRRGWKAIEGGLFAVYKQGREAMHSVRADASDEALHEWRKRTKDLRYELALLQSARRPILKSLAEGTHRLTDLLGEDHDLAVLRTVATDVSSGGACIDADSLIELIDKRRKTLQNRSNAVGAELYERAPSLFVRGLKRQWRRSRSEKRG